MTTHPDPAGRCPDAAALGSLPAAVRKAAAERQGPAAVVELKWRTWLQAPERTWSRAHPDWQSRHRALIEAAYAEPVLRQLYPWTSHMRLQFSTTTGYPYSPSPVCLEAPRGDGPYVLRVRSWGSVTAETATAQEAVALAATFIPDDIGPAVEGPYRHPEPSRGRDSTT